MSRFVVFITAILLLFSACGGSGGFEIIKKPKPDSVGFLDPDTLQMIGEGYPSPLETDPLKRKAQSMQAALINARMRLIDFFLTELKDAKDEEHYMALAVRVGSFSPARYDPVYGKELLKGGSQCDAILDMLSVRGYVYKSSYDLKTHRTRVIYRVVKAGLIGKAKSGFTQ